jgi:RNA polymerase sigma-70 factor (ECF subfamily)
MIYTWLYRIATNECIRLFRKNKKSDHRTEELTDKIAEKLSGHDLENSEDILVRFQKAILQLPEKQRIVFNLRYYDELSYDEISQIMKTSANSLKTNYHYAQEKIKQYMLNY